jgi:uncharacterized protein (TIGR02118 family)
MFRMTVQYATPEDPAAFDAHYFDTHVPLCSPVPGLLAASFSKPRALGPGEAPYLVAELDFADADSFRAAMKSPEMAAVAADAANLAAARVTFTGEVTTA